MQLTHRQNLVLAALASSPGAEYAPVQIQKMFFLLDQNVSGEMGGPQFAFEPYDYGPFDKQVYEEMDRLIHLGFARVIQAGGPSSRKYHLTPRGLQEGQRQLTAITPRLRDYMTSVSDWVRKLSFAQLVGSIYQAYPAMRVNSIFRG